MRQEIWLKKHTGSLRGKTVAVTGATGGLGLHICTAVAALEGDLLLIGRSREKCEALRRELLHTFPQARIRYLLADLTRMDTVRTLCDSLTRIPPDILVLNAGAYQIPRDGDGFDPIFEINFLAHYYMVRRLLPLLSRRHTRVLCMGSIAHRYSKTDPEDVDFSTRQKCSLVYGNAKRMLMFSLDALMEDHPEIPFVIAHPGITLTAMSAHHPPRLFALMKPFMKVLFPSPRTAARSMILGMFLDVPPRHWLGPGLFSIWGPPRIRPLTGCSEEERRGIAARAEALYCRIRAEE